MRRIIPHRAPPSNRSGLKLRPREADFSSQRTLNPPSNIPAAGEEARPDPALGLDPLVESYRKLADVFHELLSEQSLDDLLTRIAHTVRELIPYDDITFY